MLGYGVGSVNSITVHVASRTIGDCDPQVSCQSLGRQEHAVEVQGPLREFDAQLFRLVDHFGFELLRLQLGSRWVGKKDRVIEFVQMHTPCVVSLASSKFLFHWKLF